MQYGQDTGNPAATFHEVRVWKEEHEIEGKPLIPLRIQHTCMMRVWQCLLLGGSIITLGRGSLLLQQKTDGSLRTQQIMRS